MSRIDGGSTIRDIGYATGMPEDRVEQCLVTLENLGAIDYAERPYDPSRNDETLAAGNVSGFTQKYASPKPAETPAPPPSRQTVSPSVTEPVTPQLYDPIELNVPCDLEIERRKAILDIYFRLETLDHYGLLGINKNADRKAIKAAYYERVKVFHPDRYYGKNLGDFRGKLEKCFARLTDAHETLVSVEKRAEYDGYLQSQQQAEELERSLNQSVSAEDLDQLERRLAEAMSPVGVPPLSNPAMSTSPFASPTPPPPSSASSPAPASRQLSEEERKKALARKLRLSQPNLRIGAPASVPQASVPPKEHLAEQLKRQYAQGRQAANLTHLQELLVEATTAMEKGDPVQAANSLRVAQSIAPQDQRIAERLIEAQSLAATALASTYLKQGEYEEKSGRFEAAARSYERAARGCSQASTWEAAARCLLEAEGDLRVAGDFARKAVALDPERPSSHLVLGRIFMAARMRSSALAELERARSLDPNNDTVTALLKRLERESF